MGVKAKERQLEMFKEAMSYDDLAEKIRDLIDPKDVNGSRTYRYYIRETFAGYCVVRDTDGNKFYKVTYTVDANDNVTVGTWQEVEYVLQVTPGTAEISQPVPATTTTTLTEGAEAVEEDISGLTKLTEAVTSGIAGKFRMTVLRPGWNTRLDGGQGDKYYTSACCNSFVPLIEGAQAYADHPTEREDREKPERSIRELVGRWSEAKQEPDGRVTATFTLLESAGWLRPALLEAASDQDKVFVGPSINGFGLTRIGDADGRRGRIVESAKILRSVDIVTKPAAGGSVDKLLESQKPKEGFTLDWKDITPEALKKNRPDLVDTVSQDRLQEAQTSLQTEFTALKESVATVSSENKALRSELNLERVKAVAQTRVTELLRESKLPEISQKRLGMLLTGRDFTKDGAVDEVALKEAVTSAIADEKAYITKLTESGRVVDMGGGEAPKLGEKVAAVQAKVDKLFGLPDPKEGK